MAEQEQITLYWSAYSPYVHRVHIALEEAGAKYTKFHIDTQNKPEWYAALVNPAGKIPAITYGGPAAPPDAPSPLSTKLAESLVLLDFLADLFPSNPHLLPPSPVQRARARLFVIHYTEELHPKFFALVVHGGSADAYLDAVAAFQALLPPAGGFALGAWSNADAAVAPWLLRGDMFFRHELGTYAEGEGRRVLEALAGERFARFGRYLEDIKARPSVARTWDLEANEVRWGNHPVIGRKNKPASE